MLIVDFSYDRCFAILFNRVGESTYITVFGVENSKEEVSNFLCKSSSWESAYFKWKAIPYFGSKIAIELLSWVVHEYFRRGGPGIVGENWTISDN